MLFTFVRMVSMAFRIPFATVDPMHLFSGSSHPKLAEALAKELKTKLGTIVLKAFSNGERYVRFQESVRGKDVYLLQTGTLNPNEDLIELFLICQAAKLSFAKSVHVVMPHFPYARQDRVATPREPISAKLVAHMLEESGADHVITMHLHSDQIQGFFSIPVDVLDARPILADYLLSKKLKDFVIVAHMIDTASTLAAARTELLKRGANKDVYAMATHAILSVPAIERLNKAKVKEIVVTDSLPVKKSAIRGLTVLPIAPMLAQVIGHIDRGESVTAIYHR